MLTGLRIVLILISLVLIVTSTIISSNNQANAGSAFGGSSDNYFSKNKGASKEARLNMIMKATSVLLILLAVFMAVIQK